MKNMWKISAILSLIVIMLLTFVACGNGDGVDSEAGSDSNAGVNATTYTVTFIHSDGSEEIVTVNKYDDAIAPAVKPIEGYSVEWESVDLTDVSSNMTVKSVVKLIDYSITYVDAGTVSNNPSSYNVETATFSLADAEKTGFKFLGWYLDSEFTNKVDAIQGGTCGDLTLYANWQIESYSIEYVISEGATNNNPTTYNVNSTVRLSKSVLKGYDFVGWFLDAEYTRPIEVISSGSTGDLKLYAKYELGRYDITYHLNGGTNNPNNPKDFNKEESFVFEDPTKPGYEFLGWYINESCTDASRIRSISKGTAIDLNVYAKWEIKVYEIQYVVGEHGEINTENPETYTIEDNAPLKAPANIEEGYNFIGWYFDESYSKPITNLNGIVLNDGKIFARYEPIMYNIKYDMGGGTNPNSNPLVYTVENFGENALELYDPSYLGCEFLGWYYGEEAVTTVPAVIGGVTLTAKWEYNEFNVTYVLNAEGATNTNPATFSRKSDINFVAPTLDANEFIDWYLDENFTTPIKNTKGFAEDITVYARWGKKIKFENFTSITEGTTARGSVDKMFDGNTTPSQDGWYPQNGWAANKGTTTRFDLDKEYYIETFDMYFWQNCNSCGIIRLYDEEDNEVAYIDLSWTWAMDGAKWTIAQDINVKYFTIEITNEGGQLLVFVELIFICGDKPKVE